MNGILIEDFEAPNGSLRLQTYSISMYSVSNSTSLIGAQEDDHASRVLYRVDELNMGVK